jgi:CDGSH-type Zn-finger protein
VSVKPRQRSEICASADGPLLVTGGVRVVDAQGNVLHEGERAALCRCGGSKNKPFCDGTHRTNGFQG